MVWKRWLLVNMAIFGIYVKFLGGNNNCEWCDDYATRVDHHVPSNSLPCWYQLPPSPHSMEKRLNLDTLKKTLSLLQHEDFNALNRTCRFRENPNFRLLLSILKNVFNHQNPTSCGWVMLRFNQATRVGVFGDRKYQRFQNRNPTFQWFNERMWWYK